jgi:hypothetical protein
VTASHYAVLVLWGQGFDEIAASIFVAELRRLGIHVKLVGLKSRQSAGQHGLTLVPDLTLGQALRMGDRIHCIIVPAPLAALQPFSYDPRLAELLRSVGEKQPSLVVNALSTPQDQSENPFFSSLSTAFLEMYTYPPVDALLLFIQEILEPRLRRR